jgi:hypothetical protein
MITSKDMEGETSTLRSSYWSKIAFLQRLYEQFVRLIPDQINP